MVRGLHANDDIALFHAALQAAGAAGIDNVGGIVFIEQDRGGDGSVHFADAALREQDGFAGEHAARDADVGDGIGFCLADAALQQGHFLLHRADDGDRGVVHICGLRVSLCGYCTMNARTMRFH